MRNQLVVLAAASMLFACGDKKKDKKGSNKNVPAKDDKGTKTDKAKAAGGGVTMPALAKEGCACADKACAEGVLGKFKAFMTANRDKRVAPAEAQKVNQASKQLTQCLMAKGIEGKQIIAALQSASKPGPTGGPAPAVPATGKAATTEARTMLAKLLAGARTYYMDSTSGGGITPTPAQFPAPSQGPTPPLGTCCKGDKKMCKPDAKLWTSPVWVSLQFSIDDPHRYSYAYKVDGKTFTVSAYGDLDCDGEYSTFEMSGDAEGKIKPKIKITKELE